MKAIFHHELRSYFTTPMGYVFLIMYTLLAGVVAVFVNIGQEMSASTNLFLSGMQLPFMLIAPILTMRLFAEERRTKTDQLLLTAPVRIVSIVLGKALACFTMLLIAMGLTVLFPVVISRYAQVSATQIAVVYLGYFLLDTAMLSAGVLVSSLCMNQVTAAVITLGVNVFLYLSEHFIVPQLSGSYLSGIRMVMQWLPSAERLGEFANGVISPADVTYFLGFTALMLFLTCRVIEARRHAKG